jgi:hypothetical protein
MERLELASLAGRSDAKDHVARAAAKQYILTTSTLVCGDGKGVQRTILAQGFGEAIGLQVDPHNDCVWVADMCGRLWKCDRKGPARKIKVFEDELAVFGGLAIVHARAN